MKYCTLVVLLILSLCCKAQKNLSEDGAVGFPNENWNFDLNLDGNLSSLFYKNEEALLFTKTNDDSLIVFDLLDGKKISRLYLENFYTSSNHLVDDYPFLWLTTSYKPKNVLNNKIEITYYLINYLTGEFLTDFTITNREGEETGDIDYYIDFDAGYILINDKKNQEQETFIYKEFGDLNPKWTVPVNSGKNKKKKSFGAKIGGAVLKKMGLGAAFWQKPVVNDEYLVVGHGKYLKAFILL